MNWRLYEIIFKKFFLTCLMLSIISSVASADWAPKGNKIMTKWAADVKPDSVLPEYPRPMMVRAGWTNLNGLWEYSIQAKDKAAPVKYQGSILVPFPVESALSGVAEQPGKDNALWYKRTFKLPAGNKGGRTLLHFGAVDWKTTVWINGGLAGSHKGGYDSFSFDITSLLNKSELQEIVVSVYDPIDSGKQPLGKQAAVPSAIWYTSVTGIWQTVWLEQVPASYIANIKTTPDIDNKKVKAVVNVSGKCNGCSIEAVVGNNVKKIAAVSSGKATLDIDLPGMRMWSPDDPYLYDMTVKLMKAGKETDRISTYFGMRKISLGRGSNNAIRLFLNNQELFQYGPLDQGWWPDGLYTAPTDEALRYDVEMEKKLGFNMLRKHVKVEPQRFYYWCDKLGILVWQDMPNGDAHISGGMPDITRTKESAEEYELELKAMLDGLHNHPSIVVWTPFNEGWGQFDTARIVKWIKEYDPTRLVDSASGWIDRGVGDVWDIHVYPSPAMPPEDDKRASVIGEFGGIGLPVPGHTWQDKANWGYVQFKNGDEVTQAYIDMVKSLKLLISSGLAAAVYTQTTDVEIEVNGLMTYDRAMLKVNQEQVAKANMELYGSVPESVNILKSGEQGAFLWKYKVTAPGKNWNVADFDDSKWRVAPGGFGDDTASNAHTRTKWNNMKIWLRRDFEIDAPPKGDVYLDISNGQPCRIFLNGVPAASIDKESTGYAFIPVDARAVGTLKKGKNVMAISCEQVVGPHFIDAGIVEFNDK